MLRLVKRRLRDFLRSFRLRLARASCRRRLACVGLVVLAGRRLAWLVMWRRIRLFVWRSLHCEGACAGAAIPFGMSDDADVVWVACHVGGEVAVSRYVDYDSWGADVAASFGGPLHGDHSCRGVTVWPVLAT